MPKTKIAGVGMYIPEQVVTNNDLTQVMDTNDAWIQERTGIKERHYAAPYKETSTTMGVKAAAIAIERAGITAQDIDLILFATLSPDYYFPGCGVLLQRTMGMREIGAIDIRNQCSGFIYSVSIADQFIKTGMYKNILVVGAEVHSFGLDFTTRGRNVTVIFGDGAGAVVLQATEKENQGILSTHLHSDGLGAELLSMMNPGFHGGIHEPEESKKPRETNQPFGRAFMSPEEMAAYDFYPNMDGQAVFKKAVDKFPEVIMEALQTSGLKPSDINLLIPHQANLRISQVVQRSLELRDDQVFNNIMKYGNTTAASIPICLDEAVTARGVKRGDLIGLAAFGAGFTWGAALLRW